MLLGNARLGDRLVDIRIEGNRIAEIGPVGTGDLDLGGRWVSPGLWDNHVHFTQWALSSRRVDLSAASSAADAAAIIGSAGGSGLVMGAAFRDGLWPDAPGLPVLDAATGARLAVLVSADLHSVWLNTAALERFGHAGHPTGLLVEHDAFDVQQQLRTVPAETIDGWAREAADAAARRGVVGIVDLEMAWNLGDWQRRIAAGHDALRVEFGVYTEHLDRAIAEGLRTGQRLSELLTMGRFKVIIDGSLNTRTASTRDAYDDGSHGLLTVAPETLVPLMRMASEAGIEPDVHAIGDHANTIALDAFEGIGCRGRIEHAQLLTASDYPRFAGARRGGQRAARARDGRPRCRRPVLAGCDRPRLRVPQPARRWSDPAVRLGCSRLAPRPVAGDLGGGQPVTRWACAVASRAARVERRGARGVDAHARGGGGAGRPRRDRTRPAHRDWRATARDARGRDPPRRAVHATGSTRRALATVVPTLSPRPM